ncbi:MAG: PAS domain S-box protein [Proteobacteria bacterium]|nr:PAS domain S-box protein [Pseudomonadota bacterium]
MTDHNDLTNKIRALENEVERLKGELIRAEEKHIKNDFQHSDMGDRTPLGDEDRLKSIATLAQDAIFIKNKNRQYIFVNQAMAKIFGCNPENLLRKTPEEIFDKEDAAIVTEVDNKTFEGNVVDEVRQLEIGGHHYHFHTIQAPMRHKQGHVREIFGIVRDITALKESEKALYKSEEKYKAIVEAVNDAIVTGAIDGTIISWNKSAERIFGYTADEAIGRHVAFLSPEDLKNQQMGLGHQTIASGLPKSYEAVRLHKDGHLVPVEVTLNVIRDDQGSVTGLTGILRDISDRKKAEEKRKEIEAQLLQAQKMEAIGTLAGGVAHDFNNILGIILGNVELAMENMGKHSLAHESLNESRIACLRARDLIRQILNFSRKADADFEPVVLENIVRESLKLIRASVPSSIGIEQHFKTASDVVLANPTQINQIMLNLCAKGLHAMEGQKGTLSVRLDKVRLSPLDEKQIKEISPGDYLKLSVQDSGEGITSDLLDRIFEPYFTTKEVGKGSGLGLSVVYGIVKSHHGAITVASAPGKGSAFDVYLPIYQKQVCSDNKMEIHVPCGHERILFVDDEEMIARLFEKMLISLGYEVRSFRSAIDALDAFRAGSEQFDLVITDMTMPDITGDRLAKEMMIIRPDIPVMLCTGHSSVLSETEAYNMGIRKYLNKPVTKSHLAEAIRSVLDG